MENDFLRTVSFLRDLDDAELSGFAKLFTIREIKPKERILEEGTIVKNLYIISDGAVHIRRLAQTREVLLGRLSAGGFFGEINLFDPGVATASIYAMKPTQLLVFDYESIRTFMAGNTSAGYKIVSGMMTEMARRLRQASARLVNSVYWTTEPVEDQKRP